MVIHPSECLLVPKGITGDAMLRLEPQCGGVVFHLWEFFKAR